MARATLSLTLRPLTSKWLFTYLRMAGCDDPLRYFSLITASSTISAYVLAIAPQKCEMFGGVLDARPARAAWALG